MPARNLLNQTFGHLLVIGREGSDQRGAALWECRCECGTLKVIRGSSLVSDLTTSCGCVQRTKSRTANTTHGFSRSIIYNKWSKMKSRCLNPQDAAYGDYGGRGITITEEWLEFERFWAGMFPTYQAGLELDRIDNDGPYCKNNCRWATRRVNNSNTRVQRDRNYPVGVYRTGDRYRTGITVNRKFRSLGTYDTMEEASGVYQDAVGKLDD